METKNLSSLNTHVHNEKKNISINEKKNDKNKANETPDAKYRLNQPQAPEKPEHWISLIKLD